jgi:hypothetical protein
MPDYEHNKTVETITCMMRPRLSADANLWKHFDRITFDVAQDCRRRP